jgi:hypothetical protein
MVIRWIAWAIAFASFAWVSSAQSQIAGDWQGTLSASGAELHLVLHVSAGKEGTLKATLDSVDQGAYGIPVSAISFDGSRLSLTVAAVSGKYEGSVKSGGTRMEGTWTQGASLPLSFTRVAAQSAPKPAAPTNFDGRWAGELDLGTVKLRIIIEVANTESGLTARLQSPDQSPVWVTASAVSRNAGELRAEFLPLGASFAGKISADRQSLDGTFNQNGARALTLKRVKE